jgi:hypothetical protein
MVDKFMENYAIMSPVRGIGFKDRTFVGIFLGKEVVKSIFCLREPRRPHNLGLGEEFF